MKNNYSYYEVSPVKETKDEKWPILNIEVCEESEAQYYSVYGRFLDNGIYLADAIADFKNVSEANSLSDTLNSYIKAKSVIDHILTMKDDAYLTGHPEFNEIIKEAKFI